MPLSDEQTRGILDYLDNIGDPRARAQAIRDLYTRLDPEGVEQIRQQEKARAINRGIDKALKWGAIGLGVYLAWDALSEEK